MLLSFLFLFSFSFGWHTTKSIGWISNHTSMYVVSFIEEKKNVIKILFILPPFWFAIRIFLDSNVSNIFFLLLYWCYYLFRHVSLNRTEQRKKNQLLVSSIEIKRIREKWKRKKEIYSLNRLLSDDSLLHNLRSSTPFILFMHLNFLHSIRHFPFIFLQFFSFCPLLLLYFPFLFMKSFVSIMRSPHNSTQFILIFYHHMMWGGVRALKIRRQNETVRVGPYVIVARIWMAFNGVWVALMK